MSLEFGREVVAEGLEDDGMVEAAMLLDVPLGQGYALGRPMPMEAIAGWVRQFRLPTEPRAVTTPLGALTYHWCCVHSGRIAHTGSEAACPFTVFLEGSGLSDSNLAHWHSQMHMPEQARVDASQRIVDYLSERITTLAGIS